VLKPVIAIEPRPVAALLPLTVQFAPASNCSVAKFVMLLPSKPAKVPTLEPDASSTTLVLLAGLMILPENTAPGSTISRLDPVLESNRTAP
jgi:hypothetical protein